MNAKDAMLAELKVRNPALSLSQKFYTDPDYYRLDLENDLLPRLAVRRP